MLQRRQNADGVVIYVSPLLEGAGVPHAFSTRVGGVSAAPFDALNLGNPNGCAVQDPGDHLDENYRRLRNAAGLAGRSLERVHQVHAAGVVVLRAGGAAHDPAIKADAMVSTDLARAVSVRVADCVPVLLSTADGRAVAAVHAGWRGVVGGVLPAAIDALRREHARILEHAPLREHSTISGNARSGLASTSPSSSQAARPAEQPFPAGPARREHDASLPAPADILAAVGPCIGFDAFEVGPEVLDAFEAAFGPAVLRRGGGKGTVDLRAALARQLAAAGVTPERVDLCDRCTYRDRDEFFSHRRDAGVTGRMAAVIGTKG